MPLEIDVSEEPWSGGQGLTRLLLRRATCVIHVEGLNAPVSGLLVDVSDEGLMLEERSEDSQSGEVRWIPRNRILLLHAAFRVVDGVAERRSRVEAHPAFLAEVADRARRRDPRHVGKRTVGLRPAGDVAREMEGWSAEDVAMAYTILREQGRLVEDDSDV